MERLGSLAGTNYQFWFAQRVGSPLGLLCRNGKQNWTQSVALNFGQSFWSFTRTLRVDSGGSGSIFAKIAGRLFEVSLNALLGHMWILVLDFLLYTVKLSAFIPTGVQRLFDQAHVPRKMPQAPGEQCQQAQRADRLGRPEWRGVSLFAGNVKQIQTAPCCLVWKLWTDYVKLFLLI